MTFEEKIKKLEKIVEKLESEKVGLNETSELFSEGVKICKECFENLSEAKGKITVLREELGKLVEKSLE